MEKYFSESLRQELRLVQQEKSSEFCRLPPSQFMPFLLSHNAFCPIGNNWHGHCFEKAWLAAQPNGKPKAIVRDHFSLPQST